MSWVQVWDILPVVLEKVHYLLPRRRCGCGRTTTAAPPFGAAGTVSYGPNLNTTAILLASEGNVPIERTAMLMDALLDIPVSSGFVGRAPQRFTARLATGGFDDAMITALRAEEVPRAEETPTTVVHPDTDAADEPGAGSAHAVTVRTPHSRLVWYTPIGSRSKTAIAGLGALDGHTGYLVRDNYAGYYQFDTQLDSVQQCLAHLIRHRKGIPEPHPTHQHWATDVITMLHETTAAITQATTNNHDQLNPQLLANPRARYDHAVNRSLTTNPHHDWTKGNHPGYTLATHL